MFLTHAYVLCDVLNARICSLRKRDITALRDELVVQHKVTHEVQKLIVMLRDVSDVVT